MRSSWSCWSNRLYIFSLHICEHRFNFKIVWNQILLSKKKQLLSRRSCGAWKTQAFMFKHFLFNKHTFWNIYIDLNICEYSGSHTAGWWVITQSDFKFALIDLAIAISSDNTIWVLNILTWLIDGRWEL